MKRDTSKLTVLALLVISSAASRFAVAVQQSEKLTFRMKACGISLFSSHQFYLASDGTTVSVEMQMFTKLNKAKQALAKELKLARRIDRREVILDQSGKKIGERIIFDIGDDANVRTVRISLKEKRSIKSKRRLCATLKHFVNGKPQPNKRLERTRH